uniref:Uncharacterized protein n=1 Tax=Romanomermis culicivorax TaxID=13658 RepID=A0A915HLM2_ROMCU
MSTKTSMDGQQRRRLGKRQVFAVLRFALLRITTTLFRTNNGQPSVSGKMVEYKRASKKQINKLKNHRMSHYSALLVIAGPAVFGATTLFRTNNVSAKWSNINEQAKNK